MTKRLLVALDLDEDTPIATQYAIQIASAADGEITGLALVNTDAIKSDTIGGGIGSMYYAEKRRRELSEEVEAKAQTLLRRFADIVLEAGVRYNDGRIDAGDPVQAIIEEMKTHDLLVAGHESHFYYADPEQRTHALAQIVEAGAAATLVVESDMVPVRKALVAYDGGLAAARTLQKFAHLSPFGVEIEVEIVHIRDNNEDARIHSETLLRQAQEYLGAYGYAPITTTSLVGGSPRERILSHCAECGAHLIVAGAYSKSGLKKWFFGSTAKALIEESEVPLFLYH
jgi:nucleotide-binding universal stress UspA family protein